MTTGDLIRSARKKANLTQAELAQKLGIPFQSISQWERNIRKPKLVTLRRIAAELNCPITDLLTTDDKSIVKLGFDTGYKIGGDEWIDYLKKWLGYSFSGTEQEIVFLLAQLNAEGQKKAIERVEELTEIPKYQKAPDATNIQD